MKITELTYSIGRTIQIKQYEPINFHASVKAEVGEGENVNQVYAQLKKIVQDQIAADTVIWENPQMAIRRMNQDGAQKRVDDVPFKC